MSYVACRFPIREVLPPVFGPKTPTGTDAPLPEPSFICLSESPVNEPNSRFPNEASKQRNARFRTFFYVSPGVPSEQGPLIKQYFSFLSKTLVNEPPIPWFPKGAPMERDVPFLEAMV